MSNKEPYIDKSTRNLMRAIKEDASKKRKPINYKSLKKQGYPKRFLKRLRGA